MATRWHIIGRGKAGWHAHGLDDSGNETTSSGGDIVERQWWADGHMIPPYQASAIDGAPVYDAEDAPYDLYASWVYRGPMVNVAIDPDGWSKLGHNDDAPHSLDYVGVERYIRLLRETVPGVRFGRVRNGAIEWESGGAF